MLPLADMHVCAFSPLFMRWGRSLWVGEGVLTPNTPLPHQDPPLLIRVESPPSGVRVTVLGFSPLSSIYNNNNNLLLTTVEIRF